MAESVKLQLATLDAMIAEEETAPKRTRDEIDMLDRMKDADGLVCIYVNNSGADLPAAAEALYIASTKLIQQDDTLHQCVGYIMALDALLAAPDVLQQAIRTLRQSLVESDPGIAQMFSASPVAPELVTPRYHKINGSTFFLDRDATLSIDEREGSRPLVKLTGEEVYGLLTFMRLPGVAQLIEQVDAADQDRLWHDFESEEREEMTRDQARALLETDTVLMGQLEYAAAQRFLARVEEIAAAKEQQDAA